MTSSAKASKGAAAKAREDEERILFPYTDVELVGGDKIVVRAWSIDVGYVQLARLIRLRELIRDTLIADTPIDWMDRKAVMQLAMPFATEVNAIVRDSVDLEPEEFRKRVYLIEDMLRLLVAVWELNIHRPDGGGVLGNLQRLVSGNTVSTLMGLAEDKGEDS